MKIAVFWVVAPCSLDRTGVHTVYIFILYTSAFPMLLAVTNRFYEEVNFK
jgi:hypothetical protein